MKKFLVSAVILLCFSSCARPPVVKPEQALSPIPWWRAATPRDDLGFRNLSDAVRQSLEYYRKLSPDATFFFGPDRVSVPDMVATLQSFLLIIEDDSLADAEKIRRIKKDFTVHRSVGSNGRGNVLFTGYYEPLLSCRTAADDVHQYPLYRKPDDIIEIDLSQFGETLPATKIYGRLDRNKVVPYYTREDIDQRNVFSDRRLEILWCDDPVAVYFLQVQGSGKAILGDGTVVSILYDGQNGRAYRSIGKYLADLGAVPREEMSMQAIRDFLRAHPEAIPYIMSQNPSYVFFRIGSGPSLGSIGAPLSPGRSIATDSRLFPKGALALMVTQKPVIENGAVKEWIPVTRFVLNQDTGGALKGPGRADLFWGSGPEAEIAAGFMQQPGELYFLMRRK
jgi:membrane-bound lytic murein transglycosylase A